MYKKAFLKVENSTKLVFLWTLRWLLSHFLPFFMFLLIYQSSTAKIIDTLKISYLLERANDLQDNGTNNNFLAQFVQELC